MKKPPEWLGRFQDEFGAVLRTALNASSGTLRSELPPSWNNLGLRARSQRSAAEGLSDYHRQYWFRLLTVMQKDFPVTAHLMGLWNFNQMVLRYLQEFPPRGHDLAKVRENVVKFLQVESQPLRIVQAATLDALRTEVFMAPASRAWQWPQDGLQDPNGMRLQASPHWGLFYEDWALVELCLRLEQGADISEPRAHDVRQVWLVSRTEQGLLHRPLPLAQARFYELLAEKPLGEALVILERETQSIPDLPQEVQRWMAASVSWGLWSA